MSSLDITELKIYPVKERVTETIAFCTATFNAALTVCGIRIREGKKGIYVAFPSQKSRERRYAIVYPANEEVKKEISNRILATYVINHLEDDNVAA